MRRRLTLSLVVLVAGALLVAGAGALIVSRTAARNQATSQLRRQAELYARETQYVSHPKLLDIVARLLRLEDARVIRIGPGGRVLSSLPSGITTRDVDALKLLAGDSTTGFSGNESFAAAPVILPLDVQTGLAPGERLAVVFTRSVGGLESSWVYLILVGGATLIIAAAVGAELSRRITRPLVEASDATARMAGGELSARVQVGRWEAPEIVLLSESINTLAAGLEATRERESQLLLSVSHDLRTPLTSIRGYAEAVEEGVSDDPVASAAVIGREARRLERLVADLLDLAKLRADHLSLDLVDVDVARVVDDVVAAQQPAAGDRGVALDFEGSSLDGRVPFVRADPDRLSQVVANLVENAISFAT
ncbi:MAG: sensor histidine kinase, partial [Acidimicrobiales bacterium]